MKCRHCNNKLKYEFLDLGVSAPSNSFIKKENLNLPEKSFPLRVMVCDTCWLVQTEDFVNASEMFTNEYAYFSSYSSSFLNHTKEYVDKMVSKFSLDENSSVLEVASNDGYLLNFVKKLNIKCLGVEPTKSTADVARSKGLEIIGDFFSTNLAKKIAKDKNTVDLAIANNVLAHVPNINDFVKGFYEILNPEGVATFENPHLLELANGKQFDTIYHEHFSYLSLTSVNEIFKNNGLTIFDVEKIPVHGGSLRYYAQKSDTGRRFISKRVNALLKEERDAGLTNLAFYRNFQKVAEIIRDEFKNFLIEQKNNGKLIAGYGAAAKGNTLLNFCNISKALLQFIVDKNPMKQGLYCPGSKIPILDEKKIREEKPDFIVIFPWNIKDEIIDQLKFTKKWGCKFVVAIPSLSII